MYFYGIGIFFVLALLCIFGYMKVRKQRRHYEQTGRLDD
jgi:hypothetical protein